MALCKGLVEFPCQWRLGPSNRITGIFAGKSNNNTFHPAAPDSQSTVSHLAQRHPLSAPKSPGLLWDLLLGAGADQVLTLAGSNPMESIEKSLCVPWVVIVSFQFSQEFGSGHTVTFLPILSNLSSSFFFFLRKKKWSEKKNCQKNIWRIAVLLCSLIMEVRNFVKWKHNFFLQRWKNNAFLL